MAEITTAGYQTFRDYANSSNATPSDWDYIEIYDDSNNAVTRVSITGDSRCQWLDADGDNVLKVEFVIQGSDADIPQPTTIKYSAIWNASTGGSQVTQKEQYAQATFNQDGDKVTLTHTVKIPQ